MAVTHADAGKNYSSEQGNDLISIRISAGQA